MSKLTMKQQSVPNFPTLTLPLVSDATAQVVEYFHGNRKEPVPHEKSGLKLRSGLVLVRTYRADPYHLYEQFGDGWRDLGIVREDDQGLQDIAERIEHVPPSPAVVEKQKQREAAERERIEASQAYQLSREGKAWQRRAKSFIREICGRGLVGNKQAEARLLRKHGFASEDQVEIAHKGLVPK